jgi:hypothetical protein
MIDSIATFLENQMAYLNVCASSICDFFANMAKMMEAHRKSQHNLTEASADLMFDLAETFRIECEDYEKAIESACQVLRESLNLEEVEVNFEKVLELLEAIQQNYRDYHSKSCFAADKYSLTLVHEFHEHLQGLSKTGASNFEMSPDQTHPLLVAYDDIYNNTVRLNRVHFEADPNAAGVGARVDPEAAPMGRKSVSHIDPPRDSVTPAAVETTPPSASSADPKDEKSPKGKGKDSKGGKRDSKAGGSKSSSRPGSAADKNASKPATAASGGAASKPASKPGSQRLSQAPIVEPEVIVYYDSPHIAAGTIDTYSGKYILNSELLDVSKKVLDDSKLNEEEAVDRPSFQAEAPEVDLARPFLKTIYSIKILTPEEETAAFDDEDKADEKRLYWDSVYKAFVPVAEEVANTFPEDVAVEYKRCTEIVEEMKGILEDEKIKQAPAYIRAHPPTDQFGGQFVSTIQVEPTFVTELLGHIRDALIAEVEVESFNKLEEAKLLTDKRKSALTEDLEDRLRTHWPRRGRVETQVKMPREAELLAHKMKTYRHIQNISSHMSEVQNSFLKTGKSGQDLIQKFTGDMADYLASLTSVRYRNLATLQAVDARARATMLKFVADNEHTIQTLTSLCTDSIDAVLQFANDWRKICPLQQPGIPGGYSQAELDEIAELVEGQNKEIAEIREAWEEQAAQLAEQQKDTLQRYKEFTEKYDQVALDLAMSEGLGQTFGGPRRRAQEKIRTEISRDEKKAGKIDELLAHLEFYVSECKRMEAESSRVEELDDEGPSTSASDTGLQTADSKHKQAADQESELNLAWERLLAVRKQLQERAAFLYVVGTPIEYPELPWRTRSVVEKPPLDGTEMDEPVAQQKTGDGWNLANEYDDIDKVCREETRDLYQKENKLDLLGEGGVPDSLEAWLAEAKNKMFGRHGYREKAWKRLWAQAGRLELLLARVGNQLHKIDEEDEAEALAMGSSAALTSTSSASSKALIPGSPSKPHSLTAVPRPAPVTYRLAVPAVTLRDLTKTILLETHFLIETKEDEFMKFLQVMEMARDKHDRLLRPRLSSPDCVDELQKLNQSEIERSFEFTENVTKFWTSLVTQAIQASREYVDDLGLSSVGLLQYLDTVVRQELLQIPPDTEIPKKRMTQKRLRKAQRVQDEASASHTANR